MKKIILLFAVSIITGSPFAQLNIGFGIKAGANFSTLTNAPTGTSASTSTKYKVGFNGGAFADFGVGSGITISPELTFSQLGGKANDNTVTLNFNYVDFTVVGKYAIPGIEGLKVYLGPQIGFLASAKIDDVDSKSFFKSTDIRGLIGAEYMLPFNFVVSARYSYGFGNIGKGADDKVTNSAINLTLGYYLFGGKKK